MSWNLGINELVDLLDLEKIEVNLFRGQSHATPWSRVYGGQVLAQALMACSSTVEEGKEAHSLHGYFILGGDIEKPIIYDVERLRDGNSFTTRRCTAIQKGRPIFNSAVSYHKKEKGIEHQMFNIAGVRAPEDCKTNQEIAEKYRKKAPSLYYSLSRDLPFEIRPVTELQFTDPQGNPPTYKFWVKTKKTLPDNLRLHQAILAYLSDYHLLSISLIPHFHKYTFNDIMLASLDHAMWFHDKVKVDEWMLFDVESPKAGFGRGFTRVNIFNQSGVLVCSVVQEGLTRIKTPKGER